MRLLNVRKKNSSTEKELKTRSYMVIKIMSIILIILGIGFFINSLSLSILGIGVLLNSIYLNIRIGVALILLAILFIIILIPGLLSTNVRDRQVTLFMISWIVILFYVSQIIDVEIFFILILLGLLIIKEGSDNITSRSFKLRMNALLFIFIIAFILVMGKIIISI